ncbi:MAG: hypothetical protein KKC19_00055 [Nanoarchaeota archaeon]|nr:hypothetical protein [Nanoarchaeota archaeon]
MVRIKFEKSEQKRFLDKVLISVACPSLRELSRRIDVNYQTLKNYYSERRLLSEELFSVLCKISKLDEKDFSVHKISDNFGQVKGGKKSSKK